MANKPKKPKAPKKFWLSLQLPIECKSRFEELANRENRSIKAQATHIILTELERSQSQSEHQNQPIAA